MEQQSPDSAEVLTGKLHELLAESDNETGQFYFQEEMVEEMMQELYKEIAFSAVPAPPMPNPSPSLSPGFIDNGKNGSCGASVSDSASTVMAGIEVLSAPVVELEDDVTVSDALLMGFGVGEEKKMDGFDVGDLDDEWLGRVLSWGQQSQVQVVEAKQ